MAYDKLKAMSNEELLKVVQDKLDYHTKQYNALKGSYPQKFYSIVSTDDEMTYGVIADENGFAKVVVEPRQPQYFARSKNAEAWVHAEKINAVDRSGKPIILKVVDAKEYHRIRISNLQDTINFIKDYGHDQR